MECKIMAIRKGRYYRTGTRNPEAKGICDRSSFAFNHSDLVKQMEWRGNSLEWTGLMVGRPFLDEPNEQLRNPEVGPDSIPVPDPKLPVYTPVVFSNQMIPFSQLPILNFASWGGIQQGVLAAPEDERLEALEEQIPAPVENISSSSQSFVQELTQAQILNNLENYDWSQTQWQI